ncbi:MAG: hypothetical protein SGPRY_008137, partial [Prymnesium sp.]
TPADVISAAMDGDIVAGLEAATVGFMSICSALAARMLVEREQSQTEVVRPSSSDDRIAVKLDLGDNGEPRGPTQLLLKPLLPRSDLIKVELRVPLGLLIEETPDGRIVVTGTLPGYGSEGQVSEGDVVRALTAYSEVVTGGPMWQQVASGTPTGKRQLKRLAFTTEGATYVDVRNAIASHRQSEGGNDIVTLVLERAVAEGSPLAPRPIPEPIQSLPDVVFRDLQQPNPEGDDA